MNQMITDIRAAFPILNQKVHGKDLVYLDNGATTQKPMQVLEKLQQMHMRLNANIHRGVHYLSEQSTQEYELARERIRSFMGAGSLSEIVFTAGTTASINLVAFSFGEAFVKSGDNIIVSEMEHHSNIVPWQMLCDRKGAQLRVLPFDDRGELLLDQLDQLMDERTKLLAVTHASNSLGTFNPLSEIIRKAHARGVPVLVDGAQGIVHGSVDVRELDCDFYTFSGHKLYGPTGIGVLYGKEKYLEQMPPWQGGGDMVKTVSFKQTTYADLPLKFEAGTANYIGAIGLGEAIDWINHLDWKACLSYEKELLAYATRRLSEIEGLRIYGQSDSKACLVSFNLAHAHPYDVGMILDKLGVAVRTGTLCCEPVMQHYGMTGVVRASFAVYNTLEEVDVLAQAVQRAQAML